MFLSPWTSQPPVKRFFSSLVPDSSKIFHFSFMRMIFASLAKAREGWCYPCLSSWVHWVGWEESPQPSGCPGCAGGALCILWHSGEWVSDPYRWESAFAFYFINSLRLALSFNTSLYKFSISAWWYYAIYCDLSNSLCMLPEGTNIKITDSFLNIIVCICSVQADKLNPWPELLKT